MLTLVSESNFSTLWWHLVAKKHEKNLKWTKSLPEGALPVFGRGQKLGPRRSSVGWCLVFAEFELRAEEAAVTSCTLRLNVTLDVLTLDLWSFGCLVEVVLSIQLQVFLQRALVCLGQHVLQNVHLPQDLAQTVDANGLLVLHHGTPKVGFTWRQVFV